MRNYGVTEKYVNVVQDMYKRSVTVVGVRGCVQGGGGITSSILFATVMDRLPVPMNYDVCG